MVKMKLIDKKQLYPIVKKQFKNPRLLSIKIATCKKDRYLELTHQQERFLFNEDGYEKNTYIFSTEKEVFHQLKKSSNVEFPNSKKLYMNINLRK